LEPRFKRVFAEFKNVPNDQRKIWTSNLLKTSQQRRKGIHTRGFGNKEESKGVLWRFDKGLACLMASSSYIFG
jgi:hypothetical protein